MKPIYRVGNLIEAPEIIIAHGCNAQGVMGSGIAKAIREAYPKAYEDYRREFELTTNILESSLELGSIIWSFINPERTVANCITQKFYGRIPNHQYVDYEAIRSCLAQINTLERIDSFAMPKLGAGLGGGDWSMIEKIIDETCTEKQPVIYVLNESDIPKGTT